MRGIIVLALLVSCYRPSPSTGAPCPDDICPDGLVCSQATRTCERASLAPDAMLSAPPVATAPPRYRRMIAIYNGAAVPLPAGFTIRVAMPSMLDGMVAQRKAKADLSDLRVVGAGAIGERDRIVDPGTGLTPAAISFALQAPIEPGAISTDYGLYYGGVDAAPARARGGVVFPVYDDFANGIASTWLRNDGPVVVGGKLVLRAGHSDALASNAATDGLPAISAVEIVARVTDPNSNGATVNGELLYYWFGYQRSGDFTPADPWALWVARDKGQIRAEQNSPVGCEGSACLGAAVPQSAFPHYYVIERDSGETRFYRDGVLSYTAKVTNQADDAVMVRNYLATSDVQIDWIRARARISPDPTVSVGAEEAL